MATMVTRIPRSALVGLGSTLVVVLFAGGMAFLTLPGFSPRALAASLQQAAGATCAQAPTAQHCNNQDPELQGCAADAETIGQASIVENGAIIGSVERRYSPTCQSWWGRVFDNRAGSQANMFITIAGTTLSAPPTFTGTRYRILYSPMVFDATPTQQVPAITGALSINASTPPASATLPAITVPGN
jgi:hypothetical protein